MLPPLSAEFAPLIEAFPSFDLDAASLGLIRPLMDAELDLEPDDALTIRDDIALGADGQPDVPIRVYEPTTQLDEAGALRPALVWIHGGGYVMGSCRNDARLLAALTTTLGIVCVSVDYRLAPEHPFPAPLDDCYSVLAHVIDRAANFGVDPTLVGIGGLSAGGGLCAALGLLARDRGELTVAFQLLDSPMLDDRQQTTSSQLDGIPVWSKLSNTFGWASYLGDLSGADSLPGSLPDHAAPGRVEDLSGLPSTFIAVGAVDGFRDEDVDYATRLAAAGVPCELHVYAGTPHGFRLFGDTAAGRQSLADITRWLGTQIDPPASR